MVQEPIPGVQVVARESRRKNEKRLGREARVSLILAFSSCSSIKTFFLYKKRLLVLT